MYKLKVDGDKSYHATVRIAKKLADSLLECGACYAELYRGNRLYAYRQWNSEWRRV